MINSENYQVGALLYCPANNKSLAPSIISEAFGEQYSIGICLEETTNQTNIRESELDLLDTLHIIESALNDGKTFYLPKIYIRVNSPEQILRIMNSIGSCKDIIAGFNLPKFNLDNCSRYIDNINKAAAIKSDIKFMPILESMDLADIRKRSMFLYQIKYMLDQMEERVVNIRVGDNDLCQIYGLRRHATETIYDLQPVSVALTDILSTFLVDYVVSGPVFEYYNGEGWDRLLTKECEMDVAAGFIGKTAIHPKQISIINNAMKVLTEDYEDAKQILFWENETMYASGNSTNHRVNDPKVHVNWAKKIVTLAEYYGIK